MLMAMIVFVSLFVRHHSNTAKLPVLRASLCCLRRRFCSAGSM